MNPSVARRDRLSRFVDLARVYRGWSRQELASNLGRDLSKVVPDSGNPKLDLPNCNNEDESRSLSLSQ